MNKIVAQKIVSNTVCGMNHSSLEQYCETPAELLAAQEMMRRWREHPSNRPQPIEGRNSALATSAAVLILLTTWMATVGLNRNQAQAAPSKSLPTVPTAPANNASEPTTSHMFLDVNGDGRVTPLDAHLVVNSLNNQGSRVLEPDEKNLDVNNDGLLTPNDVLPVIHALNNGVISGIHNVSKASN